MRPFTLVRAEASVVLVHCPSEVGRAQLSPGVTLPLRTRMLSCFKPLPESEVLWRCHRGSCFLLMLLPLPNMWTRVNQRTFPVSHFSHKTTVLNYFFNFSSFWALNILILLQQKLVYFGIELGGNVIFYKDFLLLWSISWEVLYLSFCDSKVLSGVHWEMELCQ